MKRSLIPRPRAFSATSTGFMSGRLVPPSALRSTLSVACSLLMGLSAFGQGYESNDVTPVGVPAAKLAGICAGKLVGTEMLAGQSYYHAVRMNDNALAGVDDLNAPDMLLSIATSVDEFQTGGFFCPMAGGLHAAVWTGLSYADLHPGSYGSSYCIGVHHGEQVGYAENEANWPNTGTHAMIWHGSAGSAVDLHPPGSYPLSQARACHDGEEVGFVASSLPHPGEGENTIAIHQWSHAYRWAGTAASGVDLHPAGYDASEALATNGTQQGGWGLLLGRLHALLWSGDAASAVDLCPNAYFTNTRVNAMSTTMQVGEGWTGPINASVRHALAWSGTAASLVDLNQYLPPGYTNAVATGVDEDGTIVGYAYNGIFQGGFVPSGGIAVVFAPGKTPPGELSSITLSRTEVGPGGVLQGVVSLGGPAAAGGVTISFVSGAPGLATAPAAIVIPEGQSQATFELALGSAAVTTPTTFKLYATDGVVSHVVQLTVTMVPPFTLSVGAADGGYSTLAYVTLSNPAPAGGVTIALTSGNPAVASVPATVTVPQGYAYATCTVNTSPVLVAVIVPVTATLYEWAGSTSFTVSPVPVLGLASLSIPMMVGGQTVTGTVSMSTWHNAGGAVISLTSGDIGTLQVPATVTIPEGAASVTFPVTTKVVNGLKGVSVKATYNGGNLTTTANVNPIPTVTITSAVYDPVALVLKVQASTSYANSIMTYGTDAASGPIGTMQLELGVWTGSIFMAAAPSTATVWNSNGGQASSPVTIKGVSSGGGTTTTSVFKLSISKNGKGTVTTNPTGTSFTAGTVVTLTATPDAGSPWTGWSGAVTSTAKTITVTMNSNTSLTANFK